MREAIDGRLFTHRFDEDGDEEDVAIVAQFPFTVEREGERNGTDERERERESGAWGHTGKEILLCLKTT